MVNIDIDGGIEEIKLTAVSESKVIFEFIDVYLLAFLLEIFPSLYFRV